MSVADRLSSLSQEQRDLFERLLQLQQQSRPGHRAPPPVRPVSGPSGVGDWPLSFDQERVLQLHRDDPGLVAWNVDVGSHVMGELDVPLFLAAFRELVRRHAAWRTTFPVVDGRPVQRVHPWVEPRAAVIDLSGLPAARREETGHAALYEHTRDPFDLEVGPLLRIALVRLAEREHLYQVTIHHTVTDWIAYQIFFQELIALYEAFHAGRPSPLPPPPVQFPDFAVWEREWLQGEVLDEEARFWRRELEGFPLVLDLPASRPRPPVQSQRGGLLRIAAGSGRTDRLRALAQKEGGTMFMAVLAVLNALVRGLTGRDRIVIGSNSANRPRPELAGVAGFFLTQVPFATDVSGDPTFRELLARTKRTALAAYAHQNLPFTKLIEALELEPDPSRYPVVQILLLVLEGQSRGRSGDLEFRPVWISDGNSRWDLAIVLYDYHDVGLTGALEYNADIFDARDAERLVDRFLSILDAVAADPDVHLSSLELR
jgi:condensation domain-containing protein